MAGLLKTFGGEVVADIVPHRAWAPYFASLLAVSLPFDVNVPPRNTRIRVNMCQCIVILCAGDARSLRLGLGLKPSPLNVVLRLRLTFNDLTFIPHVCYCSIISGSPVLEV